MEPTPPQMDFAEATEFSSFFDWKNLFLETRGLDRPDGRQLFQYRVSDNEFALLEDFLRSKIGALSRNNSFQYVSNRPGFADLFVLYGAEWWRRRYDGRGVRWEPILSDLNAATVEWHQYDRSECVRAGFDGWNLKLLRNARLRFLGSVAVQGGVPMRLLAEARGKVADAIGLVLRQAKTNLVSQQELQDWFESLETVPKTYRQPEIFSLLADIAWTVLDLKERASLSASNDPIEQLNRLIPNWRHEFPVLVEDGHARSLIEQLVREAATIRVQRQKVTLPVERTLACDQDDTWQIKSRVDLPDTINSSHLATLFDLNDDDLPRTAELRLAVGETVHETSIRKTAGHEKFRVSRQLWEISGKPATDEHVFTLTAPDGRSWSCTAPRGTALDEGLPWIFSGDEQSISFVRQGGGSVAETEAYVVTPAPWQVAPQLGGDVELVGQIAEQELYLHRIKGTGLISDTHGNEFRVRTGHAAATRESYEWRGDRQWFDLMNPSIAFRGEPVLYSIDEDGNQRRLQGEIGCTVIGAPLSRSRFGPVVVRFPASGDIKQRTRMLILPPEAKIGVEANDPTSGSIVFTGWKASSARVVTPEVNCTYSSVENDLILRVEVAAENRTPDQIEVELHWNHTTFPARLSLPFPARGVRCFGSNGREIGSGERIAVQRLLGTRLVIVGVPAASQKILRLRTSDKNIHRRYMLRSLNDSMSTEIRLSDYRSDIEQLLTIDDNPDSTVQLGVELAGRESFSLEITPHEALLQKDDARVHIRFESEAEPTEEDDVQVLAIRLESPGQEPVRLLEAGCDEPGCRAWDFSTNLVEPGCWLIYPARGSKLTFRPTLWHVSGAIGEDNDYANIIARSDRSERFDGLDKLIESLATDHSHPNWIEVEQLAEQVGHLPLETIDLWRRFARSSRGMAALALRFGNLKTDFLYRFAQELPFCWETVGWHDWRTAAHRSESFCKEVFPEGTHKVVFDVFLKSRIESFAAEFGALFYVLGIVSADYSDEAQNDVARLKIGGKMAAGWLFHGGDSLLNKLRCRHGDNEEWPASFKALVNSSEQDSAIAKYMCPDRFPVVDSVVNLPLVVASQMVLNKTGDWFCDPAMIHALRTHRAFDPDWFDEAFNQTIARCLADGLLDH